MTDRSGSPHFRALFESALQNYEQKTNITLAKHPIAEELENCHSVESITAILRGQARTPSEFRGNDRMIKSIKSIVSVLCRLSTTATLRDAMGLVRYRALMGESHVSDAHPTGMFTFESNPGWSRCPTHCMCLS
jgi:hypothetical protein